jgi:hypothetical protein
MVVIFLHITVYLPPGAISKNWDISGEEKQKFEC